MQDSCIAIRGCGLLAPAAGSAEELIDRLLVGPAAGEAVDGTGGRRIPEDALLAAAALPPRRAVQVDRFSLLALAAARAALRAAAATPDETRRCGLVTGNMLAGWTFTEPQLRTLHAAGPAEVSPYLATAWFPAAPQGQVTIELKMRGFAKTITADRCSGAQAIGLAFGRVRSGRPWPLLAGGVEAPVTPLVEAAFRGAGEAMKTITEGACFLFLSVEPGAGPWIRAHTTFPVPPRPVSPWPRVAARLEPFLGGKAPAFVVCNVEPGRAREVEARAALAPQLGREAAESCWLFPARVLGDCLAASGAMAAAVAALALGRHPVPAAALVLSLGHQSCDLLWISSEPDGGGAS